MKPRHRFSSPSDFPTVDGLIIRPKYLPPGKRAVYLVQLRTWSRKYPPDRWPYWLREELAADDAARKSSGSRQGESHD